MNLGHKYDDCCPMPEMDKDKVSYPCLYVSGVSEDPGLPDGVFKFSGTAKVVGKTMSEKAGETKYSFELEVMDMEPGESVAEPEEGDDKPAERINKTFTKAAEKKMKA